MSDPVFDGAIAEAVTIEHGYGKRWTHADGEMTAHLVPVVRLAFGGGNSTSVVIVTSEQWASMRFEAQEHHDRTLASEYRRGFDDGVASRDDALRGPLLEALDEVAAIKRHVNGEQ